MRTRIAEKIVVLLAACFLLLGGAGVAQTNAEVNAGIQFNFSTPGARSLGLGGAFLGLADDATAAYTNPAGLTVLSKPEVSIEGRHWSFENKFTDRGHAFGTPTNQGTDTISGLREGTSKDSTNGFSYASFVYPRERWALAVYRHEVANFQTSFKTQGAFVGNSGGRLRPINSSMDLKIINLGVAGALRFTDTLSVGADVSSYSLNLNSVTNRYTAPDYATLVNFQNQNSDEKDTTFSMGFLWKMSSKVNLGGVYRKGPRFDFTATNSVAIPSVREVARQKAKFKTPDVYGLGISYRPTDAWTITVDYDRVKYSDLTENNVNIFYNPDDNTPVALAYRAAAKRLRIDDASETHLGFEYIIARMKYPVALRFGSWYDPDHKIHFQGEPMSDEFDAAKVTAALFRPGESQIHFSAGLGFVFGEKFQLDAGYDHSKLTDTASLSSVFRF